MLTRAHALRFIFALWGQQPPTETEASMDIEKAITEGPDPTVLILSSVLAHSSNAEMLPRRSGLTIHFRFR